jgi:hypothetical protein
MGGPGLLSIKKAIKKEALPAEDLGYGALRVLNRNWYPATWVLLRSTKCNRASHGLGLR